MKGRSCGFVLVMLHTLSWVCVISRPLAPNDGLHPTALPPHQGNIAQSPLPFQFNMVSKQGDEMMNDEELMMVKRIGSSPPNCEHKCYGCIPCEATQVPTTTSHVGIQYTNYEPEGWKCKCGPTFYSP